jgi:hypothetical protein
MSEVDKKLVGKILGIVLTAAIALLAVFGYDVGVVQPRVAEQVQALGMVASRGITGFDDLAVGSVTATGAIAAGGDLSAGGKLIEASTAITVTDGVTITPAYSVYNRARLAP